MSAWEIDWSFPARAALLNMPWQDAARVDAVVQRFASTGRGDRQQIAGDPRGMWLRVPGYAVRLELDPTTRTIAVFYVFRSGG